MKRKRKALALFLVIERTSELLFYRVPKLMQFRLAASLRERIIYATTVWLLDTEALFVNA